MAKVYLFVGTHKGLFVLESDRSRTAWQVKALHHKGIDVHHAVMDLRQDPKLLACVNSSWWGPQVKMTSDLGESWSDPETPVRFPEGGELEVKRVWQITAGAGNGTLYAGVDPGALFRSDDQGTTWSEVDALTRHSSRDKWSPGMGGLMVHSICPHPADSNRMHVGISAAGVFSTEDGGSSWEPRNKGVLADFHADKYPDVGQCVHHMEIHPSNPEILYQQNHCGVYRSENAGKDWIDLSDGLPSRFGFPILVHPQDHDTIYVLPEEGPEFRCPVDGDFGVYRSHDRGDNWEKLTKGLPAKHAYLHVFRQATCADSLGDAGLYVGTSTGQIFMSTNAGDSWRTVCDYLPPIFSVESAVI